MTRSAAKLLVMFAVLVGLLASAVQFAATAHAASGKSIRVTVSTTEFEGGGDCCWAFLDFQGTGHVPMLGRAAFAGELDFNAGVRDRMCLFITPWGPNDCSQTLSLHVVGANGREMTILGDQVWEYSQPRPAQWTWTIVGGDFTGFGTYVTSYDDNLPAGQPLSRFTLTLTGTLTST
jgi:hypothetical protein